MDSSNKAVVTDKPHAACIPAPGQSHIKAMLKLSKLLHHKGFHITFVNTEFNLCSVSFMTIDTIVDPVKL